MGSSQRRPCPRAATALGLVATRVPFGFAQGKLYPRSGKREAVLELSGHRLTGTGLDLACDQIAVGP